MSQPPRQPENGPDWADKLALQIAGDYDAVVSIDAHNLVAARIRLVRAQGERDGMVRMLDAGKDVRVVCETRAYEQVKGGYPEIVKGYQRAVARIADQIARVAQESGGGVAAECPVS